VEGYPGEETPKQLDLDSTEGAGLMTNTRVPSPDDGCCIPGILTLHHRTGIRGTADMRLSGGNEFEPV
jgi:hypothetical protein